MAIAQPEAAPAAKEPAMDAKSLAAGRGDSSPAVDSPKGVEGHDDPIEHATARAEEALSKACQATLAKMKEHVTTIMQSAKSKGTTKGATEGGGPAQVYTVTEPQRDVRTTWGGYSQGGAPISEPALDTRVQGADVPPKPMAKDIEALTIGNNLVLFRDAVHD